VANISSIRRHWLIWAGLAKAGLGKHEGALECLLKCREEMDQQPLVTDWYYRMPLQWALTEVWLSKGELEKASGEAEQFLKVTLATEERTFHALVFETNARVAIAKQELERAQDCLAKALRSMEGYEVPLAAWRVHSTASELHGHLGNRGLADSHRELSRATILRLADSLPSDEPLRTTFLAAPMIRKILENGAISRLPI
jgi:tetratricopeptide (TPR) repeat protein